MNNTFVKKTVLATALAFVAGQAMAAGDSVDIKVSGQFVPAACNLTLSGGGTVDYGTIKAETIAKDEFTMLDVKTLDLGITCEAATKLALHTTDMRADSVVLPTGKSWGNGDSVGAKALGLGKDGGKNIGGWAMWMAEDTIKADGNPVAGIVLNSANRWFAPSDNKSTWLTPTGIYYRSWAAPGTDTPIALTTLTGTLSVQAGINKGSELDLTKAVHLDGMATLQVFYL